eukprot:2515276-Rhodomonas_salina.1
MFWRWCGSVAMLLRWTGGESDGSIVMRCYGRGEGLLLMVRKVMFVHVEGDTTVAHVIRRGDGFCCFRWFVQRSRALCKEAGDGLRGLRTWLRDCERVRWSGEKRARGAVPG